MSVEDKLRKTIAKLAENNVEKISVAALCEKADISRASFYVYYNDIEDFIDKTRIYIINKLDEQLRIIFDVKNGIQFDDCRIVFDKTDIVLLKALTEKNIYWEFAVKANEIIFPHYEKVMIERWGEEFYNKNKERFEFLINGGVATLYFDLLNFDKETYVKNMKRISQIAFEVFKDC